MHINLHLIESIKNSSAEFCCHLHGIHRIALINTANLNLEGLVLIRINTVNEIKYGFCNTIKIRKVVLSISVNCDSRTNSCHTKNSLKLINCLVKIKVFSLNINSSGNL